MRLRSRKRRKGSTRRAGRNRGSVRCKKTSRSSSRSSRSSSSSRGRINRAPLLILWVAIVAQREGYKFREGLTFGKAVAAICGHARGRAIGRFKSGKPRGKVPSSRPGERKYRVFGMRIPGKVVKGQIHAVKSGKLISPGEVQDYLKRSFGSHLIKVKGALRRLSKRYSRHEIGRRGYRLYEQFRPRVPEGLKGWGARGSLNMNAITKLAKKPKTRTRTTK